MMDFHQILHPFPAMLTFQDSPGHEEFVRPAPRRITSFPSVGWWGKNLRSPNPKQQETWTDIPKNSEWCAKSC